MSAGVNLRPGRRKPILLLAHLDVVDARRDDCCVGQFRLTERDGHFCGRRTTDTGRKM